MRLQACTKGKTVREELLLAMARLERQLERNKSVHRRLESRIAKIESLLELTKRLVGQP